MTNWLFRCGDGKNFKRSSKYNIWGVNTIRSSNYNVFMKEVKSGDLLWFIQAGTGGKVIAVATFDKINQRELGPLLATTLTNEELGWEETVNSWGWNMEIHYRDLYNVEECNIQTKIKSPLPVRKEDEKCAVNLTNEYENIKKYGCITRNFDI